MNTILWILILIVIFVLLRGADDCLGAYLQKNKSETLSGGKTMKVKEVILKIRSAKGYTAYRDCEIERDDYFKNELEGFEDAAFTPDIKITYKISNFSGGYEKRVVFVRMRDILAIEPIEED